jgi:putative flippase GtrA
MSDGDIVTAPEKEVAPSLEALGSETTREFLRYLAASALALLIDTGTLWILTSVLNVQYLISGAVAFLLGLSVVYILSVLWVFEHRSLRSVPVEFLVFATIGVIGLALNEGVLWLFTGFFGFHYLASKGISVVIVFSWNFIARKFLLFR